MTGLQQHKCQTGFLGDEDGAAMVEFAIVSAVFFLAFYQLFGFGLFASTNLLAEKATQIAARTAVVRPAACDNVPDRITASGLDPWPAFGTNCRKGAGTCAAPNDGNPITCAGDANNVTADEIWTRIEPMLPPDTDISDLTFIYAFEPSLGYLGGPYTPMVTVELTVPNETTELFALISRLAQNAGGGAGFSAPQYRVISISLPAEDLNSGTGG